MLIEKSSDHLQAILAGRNEFYHNKFMRKFCNESEYEEHLTYTLYLMGIKEAFGNVIFQHSKSVLKEEEVDQLLKRLYQKNISFLWWEAPLDSRKDQDQIHKWQPSNFLIQKGLISGGFLSGVRASLTNFSSNLERSIRIVKVSSDEELNRFSHTVWNSFGLQGADLFYQSLYFPTKAGKEHHYLAYDKDKPVGGITLGIGQTAGIWNFGVSYGYRQQGIGSALLQVAMQAAKAEGFQEVIAILMPGQTTLWKRFGFQTICYFPFYVGGNPKE